MGYIVFNNYSSFVYLFVLVNETINFQPMKMYEHDFERQNAIVLQKSSTIMQMKILLPKINKI